MKRFGVIIAACVIIALCAGAAFAERDEALNKALKYYGSHNYKKASELLKTYVAQKPDAAANYLLGYSLYKQKKFDEANGYFQEAYNLDPEFSLEKYGLIQKERVDSLARRAEKALAVAPAAGEKPAKAETQPAAAHKAAPAPETKPAAPAPSAPAAPAPSAPPAAQPAPQPTSPAPAAPAQPAPQFPAVPMTKPDATVPVGPVAGIMGIIAGMFMAFIAILVVVYIFFSLCLFKIATKLNVPAAWTAWVPLAQLWAFVGSAGKAWWWMLLLFVPIIGPLVGIYLWMCISENLGRSKWLGLLMIVPIANIVYLAMMAFAQSESFSEPESEPEPIE